MSGPAAEALSAVLLVLVLGCAVVRPWGLPEAAVAVPAAAVLIATGAISLDHAREEAQQLGPVIGFLAAVLVLAQLCDEEGLFAACGGWMASAAGGSPYRLLGQVFVLASVITAVLSLDATIVLLTPVVFATAARLGARPKPHVYACTHLSNTASLLLPVSNLTNLLALAASGLSFRDRRGVPGAAAVLRHRPGRGRGRPRHRRAAAAAAVRAGHGGLHARGLRGRLTARRQRGVGGLRGRGGARGAGPAAA
jgi:di/tricarboxylate transporter